MKTVCSLSHVAQKLNARMTCKNSDVTKPKISLSTCFVLYQEQTLCKLFLAQCSVQTASPEAPSWSLGAFLSGMTGWPML